MSFTLADGIADKMTVIITLLCKYTYCFAAPEERYHDFIMSCAA